MNTSTENGMQMMFEQLELPICQLQTAGPSEHLAKISASLEEEQDLKASEAVLCERFLESWKKQKKHISPNGLFMKTLKECCLLAEDLTSCQSSLKWTDSGTMQNGRLSIQDGMFRKIGSQNRERVYVIGHNRRRRRFTIFPITGNGGENSTRQLIGGAQAHRVYDSNGIACTQNAQAGGVGAKTGLYAFGIDKSSNKPQELQVANCLMTKDCGVSKRRSEDIAIAIPVLTPSRAEKRQNGRRCKEVGEEMFTLTAQDQHGIAIKVKEATKQGYAIADVGDSINFSIPNSKSRRGRVGKNIANTLDTSCNQAVVTPTKDAKDIWAVWSEKYKCYLAIRKLTPKECFRLQGWTDDYFEKAEFVNSNSQLYKQAGNGVTVNVVEAIGRKITENEHDN